MPNPQSPTDTQQTSDFYTKFKSYSPEKQKALIGKMSAEQKLKLKAFIVANKKANADPYEGNLTATAENKIHDVSKGVAKGAMESATAVSTLLNKIPVIGETLAPKSGIEAAKKFTKSENTGESAGKVLEGIGEFAAGDEAIKGLSLAIKLKNWGKVAQIVQKYPWLSKYASVGIKNYTLGAGQSLAHGDANPNRAGLVTAGVGVAGEGVGSLFEKYAPKAATKTYEALNRYLGLRPGDMKRWEKLSPGDVRDVGKTVLEHVGIKGSLEEQAFAIEAVRTNVQKQTESLLTNKAARSIPLKASVDRIANGVADEAERLGTFGDRAQIDAALQKNKDWVIDKVRKAYGTPSPYMSAIDTLKLRREVDEAIDWGTYGESKNLQQMFLAELRGELNDGIKSALPSDAASQFERLNKIHGRLLVAKQAANRTVVKEGLSGKLVGAAGGAAIGGYEGYQHGGVKGAVVGAVGGAIGGATVGKMVSDPKTQLLARKGIKDLLPVLQTLAKKSPAVASALQSVLGDKGGSSGSIAATP